jgi:preprotein translocase subunit SecA
VHGPDVQHTYAGGLFWYRAVPYLFHPYANDKKLMLSNPFTKLFGSRNDRTVKRHFKVVELINALEAEMEALDDEALQGKTAEFRGRLENGEALDDLLPEAFAVVRETGKRVLSMRHFDVQMVGGITLHQGRISEMRTGEGKTLVATLPAYLNALPGNGVHIVTVNDYLAKRDSAWMGQIFSFLGMTIGVVIPGLTHDEKREAYNADVVYGTNNEFGFDYLRDNMAFTLAEKMQGPLSFAVIDEVDSILIDEARTPLIISGPTDESSDFYVRVDALVPTLVKQEEEEGPGDFSVDEKARQVFLTEEGHGRIEELLERDGLLSGGASLYDSSNIVLMHHVNAALRAHALFQRNVDYIVRDDEVIIVDEFTGRTMPGRRWSEGLHQAVEAKEGATIQNENQTLASITFQNYFRLYQKLSGMTGTADTEAAEFHQIYGLEVVVIPTHRDMVRDDRTDLVYLTKKEKFDAIIDDIRDCQAREQPVLAGTASIETSEYLSELLTAAGIEHRVLNAKQHAMEAEIVAQAGRPGKVTIATNMAGRGTDIVLGGNLQAALEEVDEEDEVGRARIEHEWADLHEKVKSAGGLHIVGSERHESRRIDNQLRGRSGRQGDPGSSRFYLSLEDDLMRIFASDRVASMMKKLGMEEGEAIEHGLVTKAIENAQKKVEGRNFDIRKQLLEFDDVANDQRKEVYALRNEMMSVDDVSDRITVLREDVVEQLIDTYVPPQSLDELWDIPGLAAAVETDFGLQLDIQEWLDSEDDLHEEPLRARILERVEDAYKAKEEVAGAEIMRAIEKAVMLQVLDTSWKEHLAAMDYLRQGIHLRGYAQKNPKQEYKREAFEMFGTLLDRFKLEVAGVLAKGQIRPESDPQAELRGTPASTMQFQHADADALNGEAGRSDDTPSGAALRGAGQSPRPPTGPGPAAAPFVRPVRKVGRNEACPCGSGKKYKQCHGKLR